MEEPHLFLKLFTSSVLQNLTQLFPGGDTSSLERLFLLQKHRHVNHFKGTCLFGSIYWLCSAVVLWSFQVGLLRSCLISLSQTNFFFFFAQSCAVSQGNLLAAVGRSSASLWTGSAMDGPPVRMRAMKLTVRVSAPKMNCTLCLDLMNTFMRRWSESCVCTEGIELLHTKAGQEPILLSAVYSDWHNSSGTWQRKVFCNGYYLEMLRNKLGICCMPSACAAQRPWRNSTGGFSCMQ